MAIEDIISIIISIMIMIRGLVNIHRGHDVGRIKGSLRLRLSSSVSFWVCWRSYG